MEKINEQFGGAKLICFLLLMAICLVSKTKDKVMLETDLFLQLIMIKQLHSVRVKMFVTPEDYIQLNGFLIFMIRLLDQLIEEPSRKKVFLEQDQFRRSCFPTH